MKSKDVDVIWRAGDGAMPEDARRVVDEAQNEYLFRTFGFSEATANTIRYNSEKQSLSIVEYLSKLIKHDLQTA
ncbi:MAG: hypothetical protein LBL67_03445 [Coriobacteriales bacterium]|jgi:hypothetical protein|nr:hypothetical protein [Coriobacteriales bacterium]